MQQRIAEDISRRQTVKLTLPDNWWVCIVVVFFTHNLKVWHCWRLRNVTEMPTQSYRTVSVTISRLLIVLSQKKSEHFLSLFTSPDAISTIVRKVLGCAKTFSNIFHHYVSQAVSTESKKRNSARNAICVQYRETIKTTNYNDWNKGLMKRLRQSIVDPLWPVHEKGSSRQNAYKAASLPLWSDMENSPSGVIITFSLWQSSNSHT